MFSAEYKAETVRLIQRSGKSIGQMALEITGLPNDTVMDGEIVALDDNGRTFVQPPGIRWRRALGRLMPSSGRAMSDR